MLPVEQPFKIYTGLDGKPLDNGYVYFGQPSQNPATAPVTVYWDTGGTQPAKQPLRTVNGYIERNGTPANVFYDGPYSELVLNSKGQQVFYSQTSDDFSIATAISNLISNLASSIGAALIGWSNGGTKITVEDGLDLMYFGIANVRNPKYAGGADATGATFSTAAFQAAFNDSPNIYAPAGTYKLNDTISKITSNGFRLIGEGLGLTYIQMWADKDMFSITNTGGSTQFTFEDMTLQPRTNMITGAAINVRNDTALPSLRVANVFIGQTSTYEFKYGIKAQNCTEAVFDRVVQYGLGTSNFIAWEITASVANTAPKWFECSVYNARYGMHIINSTAPGIEGTQFYGCDLTNVSTGVFFENTYGTGYFPPQLTWIGGHINATLHNFDLNIMSQATILGTLLYNSGGGSFINLNTCSDVDISHNKFFNIGGGTPTGLDIYSSTGPINLGIISNNYFNVGASSLCMHLDVTQPFQNGQISNNERVSGLKTLDIVGGSKDASIRLSNNTPDAVDYYDTVALSGSTLSVAGKRSKFFGASGAGTATTMPGGYPGDTVTLKCDSGLTLQHNVSTNGFLLKGAVDFTFSSGSLITLTMANGGYWTEVSRSV